MFSSSTAYREISSATSPLSAGVAPSAIPGRWTAPLRAAPCSLDRKSTRLNSSHVPYTTLFRSLLQRGSDGVMSAPILQYSITPKLQHSVIPLCFLLPRHIGKFRRQLHLFRRGLRHLQFRVVGRPRSGRRHVP